MITFGPKPKAMSSQTSCNVASEAFRKCSASLIKALQDPLDLAWELHSVGVVTSSVVDKLTVEGFSAMQKKTTFVLAIGNQIDTDPTTFQKVIHALRQQQPLKKVADELDTTYKPYCGMCIK